MADVSPIDYTTDVGRVRKYIPDIVQLEDPRVPLSSPEYMWHDDALQSFIEDEADPYTGDVTHVSILRAAASALVATANNEALVLKKIVTEDLQTDGPSVAKALLQGAKDLRDRADRIELVAQEEEVFLVVDYPAWESSPSFTWRY